MLHEGLTFKGSLAVRDLGVPGVDLYKGIPEWHVHGIPEILEKGLDPTRPTWTTLDQGVAEGYATFGGYKGGAVLKSTIPQPEFDIFFKPYLEYSYGSDGQPGMIWLRLQTDTQFKLFNAYVQRISVRGAK